VMTFQAEKDRYLYSFYGLLSKVGYNVSTTTFGVTKINSSRF